MFPPITRLDALYAGLPPLVEHPRRPSAARLAYEQKNPGVQWSRKPIQRTVWSRPPEYGDSELMEAEDRYLCRLINQDMTSFMMLVGAVGADGDSFPRGSRYLISQGGPNIPFLLQIMDSFGISRRALELSVVHTTRFAGKRPSGDGVVNETASVGYSYRARLDLGKWPKFAKQIQAMEPKNVVKNMKNKAWRLGFHFGDGTQSELHTTVTKKGSKKEWRVNQRVASQYAEAYAKEFNGQVVKGKVIHPTPLVRFNKKESINYILNLYDGITEDMPVHPIKFQQFVEMKDVLIQELTKMEAKVLQKNKFKVQGGQLATTPTLEAPRA